MHIKWLWGLRHCTLCAPVAPVVTGVLLAATTAAVLAVAFASALASAAVATSPLACSDSSAGADAAFTVVHRACGELTCSTSPSASCFGWLVIGWNVNASLLRCWLCVGLWLSHDLCLRCTRHGKALLIYKAANVAAAVFQFG